MKSTVLNRYLLWVPAMIGGVVFLGTPSAARAAAANGGQPLPWEGPLNQVLASFTGPVAKALCILSIVVIGSVLLLVKAAGCDGCSACCSACQSQ